MIGQNILHYSVVAKLGKGGMGEVYQAKDQKLGRDVAIKILPEEFAKDADRVARFQREAKLLASLNHRNIAVIYGVEEAEGKHFLVLELVEGETLSEQLKRGPIPVEESLKLALQIAEALEAAHEKGVIHRDLKPSNIKVTAEGKVKVLDFGLAKAFAGDQEEMILSDSPTISAAATQKGVILGTAAYMSPEQAKGKSVDKRTDIWAFGCVLYEMLTGQAAFQGEDVTEILAAVVKLDPNLNLLPANIHPRVREVLTRCLQKDMRRRYSGIGDARYEIEQVLSDPSGVLVKPSAIEEPRTRMRLILPWVAAAVVLTAIIAGLVIWNLKPTEPPEVTRFYYELPEGQQFFGVGMIPPAVLAVSPDGKQFVYSSSEGLFLRSIGELDAKLIAGTNKENIGFPFFSPDGKWIGYNSQVDSQLKKIPIGGGAPVVLCDVGTDFGGASWGEDNTIVYSGAYSGIMRVSANGGTPESLIKAEAELLFYPQILPDGKSVLFTKVSVQQQSITAQIVVQSLESGERKELFVGYVARYLPTGHIVFIVGDNILGMGGHNLFAVPFDVDRLEVTGSQVSLVEDIRGPVGAHYAVSDAGTLVYRPGETGELATGLTLVWVDKEGKEQTITAPANPYLFPKISPDGTRVALTISGENTDIWIWDLARKTMTRLTFDKGNDFTPIWTPDSKQVLFYSDREGKFGAIFRKQADGTGEVEKLVADPDRMLMPWSLSNDGKTLVVIDTTEVSTLADISLLSMEGDHERKPLLQQDEYIETQAKISPDGKWMAYMSNESGQWEIYVRSFPEIDKGRWQISANSGLSPLWAPNGRELFYLSDDDTSVMTVAVETGTAFSAATPKKLFPLSPYYGGSGSSGHPWDIHPDGKRFLMMRRPLTVSGAESAEAPRKINIVLNWLEELKERVPLP